MTLLSFVQYYKSANFPDGIYNGKYNSEPALIRIKDTIPVWVQFIGQFAADGKERVYSAIFKPNGIIHSNVELLLPSQLIEYIPTNTD